MQHNHKSRLRHRSKFNQLILLDENAQIIASCDSIFETSDFKGVQLIERFPFLESILPSLHQLSLSTDVSFNKVETPLEALPGFYDFTFQKIEIGNEVCILWSIFDYTDLYEDYKQYQQRRNELEIHRELLERRHRNFQHKEELALQQNIILEHLDHVQLSYFNRIKTALLSPVNPLDGMVFLNNTSKTVSSVDYLSNLQNSILLLQEVIREFPIAKDVNSANENNYYSLAIACADIKHFVSQKLALPIFFDCQIEPSVPTQIQGNIQVISQILFGLLINSNLLHPKARLHLRINALEATQNSKDTKLHFELTEQLSKHTSILSATDYQGLLCRLSIVRQLIEAHGGNIQVSKDPKALSISIAFDFYPNQS